MSPFSRTTTLAVVRVLKVRRAGEVHDLRDITVRVLEAMPVAPTPATLSASVHASAGTHTLERLEAFGLAIVERLLADQPTVLEARIELSERSWTRVREARALDAMPHPRAFRESGPERWIAEIAYVRGSTAGIASGIRDLRVVRTGVPGGSGGLLIGTVEARWEWARPPADFAVANQRVLDDIAIAFAGAASPDLDAAVQAMGAAALAATPEIARVHLRMDAPPSRRLSGGPGPDDEVYAPADLLATRLEGTFARR